MKNYFKIIPAAYIIFRKADKVLLLKRANTGYHDGSFSLPAGHLDGNEPAVTAAIREAKEEVGVDIKFKDLQFKHTIHRLQFEPVKNERVDFYFETTTWKGKISNLEPQKCSELKWASIKHLPKNMVPEVRQALEKIALGEYFSEMNF